MCFLLVLFLFQVYFFIVGISIRSTIDVSSVVDAPWRCGVLTTLGGVGLPTGRESMTQLPGEGWELLVGKENGTCPDWILVVVVVVVAVVVVVLTRSFTVSVSVQPPVRLHLIMDDMSLWTWLRLCTCVQGPKKSTSQLWQSPDPWPAASVPWSSICSWLCVHQEMCRDQRQGRRGQASLRPTKATHSSSSYYLQRGRKNFSAFQQSVPLSVS